MAAALDDFVVASKLHVEDVIRFVRAIAQAAAPPPVLVSPAVVRRGRRARERRFEVDDAPARRRVAAAPRREGARPPVSRARAVVALGVALVALGVGTAIGLRAKVAVGKDVAPQRITGGAAVTQPPRPTGLVERERPWPLPRD
jgi:hypothetical protein